MTTLDALRRGDLSGARELRLGHCGLTEVPREIFGHAETLEVLDLSGNALTDLPEDFGRLTRLRALFCSGNAFLRLPAVLGECPALSQIGCRGGGLREIPAESLPAALRWLTLTDNRLDVLPDAIGERPALQKLMLAGNRLRDLPESLGQASRLELLRLSANDFEDLPAWLVRLPRLAWLAWAGNPMNQSTAAAGPMVAWSDLQIGSRLGEGASGQVYQADWRSGADGEATPVAVKLFRGGMTSDGLPACEMAACLAAGQHANLVGGLGRVSAHPDQIPGLLMRLLPVHWQALAGPPSLETCSRDVYDPGLRLPCDSVCRIAAGIAAAAAHLHACGLLHGDLYAHNILWDGGEGKAVLSDFGAASPISGQHAGAVQRLDVLAWSLLLRELLDRCDDGEAPAALLDLQRACGQSDPAARPTMKEASAALAALS